MGWTTAPYLPTPPEIVRRMLKIAGVGPGDVVYDLGCGDGHILIMAIKEFGADRAVGYEIRENLCRVALAEIERQGLQSRVKLVNRDLFDADLNEVTVITLYLDESTNQRLKPKLERTARVGTRIVSYAYKIKGWKPAKKERRHGDTIYLYRVPESINRVHVQ
ncbi:MAG: cyclopropane-fatty-acyl-phospholipid synthase family protein [Candidatus Bathyarchaeia archaeon]